MSPDDFILVNPSTARVQASHEVGPYARVHLAFPADQYPAARRALGWPH